MTNFPKNRLRRLRQIHELNIINTETILSIEDLIAPIFVRPGENTSTPIKSMPGIYQFSIDLLCEEIENLKTLGIKAILLFGTLTEKDSTGSNASNHNGLIQPAIRAIKQNVSDIAIITDVCLCSYTTSGHCGIIDAKNFINNDDTIKILGEIALSHAEAGAHVVAPSAMMDGQVGAIRSQLDDNNFHQTCIMSYSAKYASSFYGPFREASSSTPQFGNRESYQLNIANKREAFREIDADIKEGADIVMVKPALAFLDIINKSHDLFNTPLAAFNVSGEYSMVHAAAQQGWIDKNKIILEILTSIKRSGANLIITWHAKEIAEFIQTNN